MRICRYVITTLMMCVIIFCFPTLARGEEYSGVCGENLIWTLDEAGTLTVFGTGPMTDYEHYRKTPWADLGVSRIVVEEGVTGIGANAFGSSYAQSVELPEGLRYIGDGAFEGCTALKTVIFPDSLETIGDYAFHDCPSLDHVLCVGKNAPVAAKYNTDLKTATWHYQCSGQEITDLKNVNCEICTRRAILKWGIVAILAVAAVVGIVIAYKRDRRYSPFNRC